MSNVLIALFLGAGVAGWAYVQLAKRNGNASPGNNYIAAAAAGVVIAFVAFTLFQFIFNFD